MPEKKLPLKTVILWQLRIAIFCAVITFAVAFALHRFQGYLFTVTAILVIFAGVAYIYIPALFRSYRIATKNGAVIIEHGVIIKVTHIMPFAKMIYAETLSTPLAKAMGLTALTLKATKTIVFVPEMTAAEVDNLLKNIRGGTDDTEV